MKLNPYNLCRKAAVLAAGLAAGWLELSPAGAEAIKVLDIIGSGATTQAAPAWISGDGAPPVQQIPGPPPGLRLTCPFGTSVNRVFWDLKLPLNLKSFQTLELDYACEHPEAFRSIGLYLQSGDGWYLWLPPPREAGRQTAIFHFKDAAIEGQPAGWDRIAGIRLSCTKALDRNTEILVYGLRARASDIALVRGTVSLPSPGERLVAADTTRRLSRWLTETGVPHVLLEDEDVIDGQLRARRVAILPYNSLPPRREMAALKTFVEQGGKLIVFYAAAPPLAELMGLKLGSYQTERRLGQWSGFRFTRKAPPGLPVDIIQESGNIFTVYPLADQARVIAYWTNAEGDRLPDPAWVQSDAGFWMTHILLNDDAANKHLLLIGLLGFLAPSVWQDAAGYQLARAGKVAGFDGIGALTNSLAQMAANSPQRRRILSLLADAARQSARMQTDWADGKYPQVVAASRDLQATLLQAYARLQTPRPQERRGIWDHSGLGLYPGDWDQTCRELKDAGLNLLFANQMWAGLGYYTSQVVAVSDLVDQYGDQVRLCSTAAQRHGLELHIWKICWNLAKAPAALISKFRQADRLQQTESGQTLNWLCPSHPLNTALELRSILEIATNYPIDGIHLDYIRYPDEPTCFCSGCRQRFEQSQGLRVARWPDDVKPLSGKLAVQYAAWRRDNITAFVRTTREALRQARPGLKLSAAVYGNYPECATSIGQDWGLWLREDLVDFVCPMDYLSDDATFQSVVARQLALPSAAERLYPGIGVTAMESTLTADQVISQILRARASGARGFVLFDLNRALAREILPLLSLGVTARE